MMCLRRFPVVACFLLVVACTSSALALDTFSERYFAQLRSRRLFSLGESFCLRQLRRGDLTEAQRAELTLELARMLTEHARYVAPEHRDDLWNRANAAVDAFLDGHPTSPYAPLLAVQRAFVPAVQGEMLRFHCELYPDDEELKSRARKPLNESIERLTSLAPQLKEAERQAATFTARKRGGPLPHEIRNLRALAQYQLAVSMLERAKLEPPVSADRAAALIAVDEQLKKLPAILQSPDLQFRARILTAQTARLRSDFKRAAGLLAAALAAAPPREIRDAVVAEKVRLELDAGKPHNAAALLIEYRKLRKTLPGELAFLKVRASIGMWQVALKADQSELAKQLLGQVDSQVARAQLEVGGYWGYRCRLLLDLTKESLRHGPELAAVIRRAETLYRNERIDESIAAYRHAVLVAGRTGQTSTAAELSYTLASILLQSAKYQLAADAFHRFNEGFPQEKRAADAHLLYAYSLGKLYESEPTRRRRTDYTDALIAHRRKFAGHPTAAEAAWMHALLEERRLQVTTALPLYLQIPTDHPRGPAAQVGAARCCEIVLQRLRELKHPVEAWEKYALTNLSRMTAAFPKRPAAWSIEQAETAMRLARILLNRSNPDYERSEPLLERVFETAAIGQAARNSQKAKDWKLLMATATQLRIVALAGRGRFSTAQSLVSKLSAAEPDRLLAILDGLLVAADGADQSTRRSLGELQLQAASRLEQSKSKLSEAQKFKLDRCLAQANLATGRTAKAIAGYESLLKRYARDRRLLHTVAGVLYDCGTRECLVKAVEYFRRIEAGEKPGSEAWLAARYRTADCLFRTERAAECRKLLRVTRLLYPDAGSAELRGKIAELQQRAGG